MLFSKVLSSPQCQCWGGIWSWDFGAALCGFFSTQERMPLPGELSGCICFNPMCSAVGVGQESRFQFYLLCPLCVLYIWGILLPRLTVLPVPVLQSSLEETCPLDLCSLDCCPGSVTLSSSLFHRDDAGVSFPWQWCLCKPLAGTNFISLPAHLSDLWNLLPEFLLDIWDLGAVRGWVFFTISSPEAHPKDQKSFERRFERSHLSAHPVVWGRQKRSFLSSFAAAFSLAQRSSFDPAGCHPSPYVKW